MDGSCGMRAIYFEGKEYYVTRVFSDLWFSGILDRDYSISERNRYINSLSKTCNNYIDMPFG